MSGGEEEDRCGDVPEEVKKTFLAFSDDGIQMHEDDLRRFLIDQQGRTDEDALEEAERILSEKSEFLLEDFYGYLFDSELNPPIRSSQVVCVVSVD